MSSTASTNNNEKTEATTTTTSSDSDWRVSVQQSYRNAQVRQIAKVLASLEPGASEASKLRLAMQFEDSIFKLGTSLADYHKRLTKRLKKVQKNYVPVADATACTQQAEKERTIQGLIAKHGNDLKYIVKNSAAAIKEMREKYGEEKATQLQQHTDSVKMWATDLGLVDNASPNYTMSDQQLQELQECLEKRLQNVRSHTVKLVEPDAFRQETLQKIQDDFKDKGRAVRIQAENMLKRYEQLQTMQAASRLASDTNINARQNPDKLLLQALEQALKPVPILASSAAAAATKTVTNATATNVTTPRASNTTVSATWNKSVLDARTATALLHLDKMRAASTVVLAYLCVPDKHSVPNNALAKAHDIAMAGIEVVQKVMREQRHLQRQQTDATTVHLQDAWLKPIIVPTKAPSDNVVSSVDGDNADPPAAKRQRTLQRPGAVLRTRVLLTAGRKTPSNLVSALQSNGVKLIRPPPSGAGSCVQLEFEQAFVMTIYFVPLLVTLRAYRSKEDDDENDDTLSKTQWKCGSWTPLHHGLPEREELTVGGGATVKSTYETVGLAVEERLRDASAHATLALRTCFANATSVTAATAGGDFEQELLEASALLEFVQLARDTYTPQWKDEPAEASANNQCGRGFAQPLKVDCM